MNKWPRLVRSIMQDIPAIKKPLFFYSIVYLGSVILSNLANKLPSENATNLSMALINLFLGISISIIQSVNAIYFQRAYTRAAIGETEFTPAPKVIFQVFRIYIIQMLIILPVALIFLVIMTLFTSKGYDVLKIMPFVLIPFIALTIPWMARLIFISMIIVYKREKNKMKEIIAESKALIKGNLSVVLPILALQFLPMLYVALDNLISRNPISYPLSYSILTAATSYLSSLVYFKIVIEKYGLDRREDKPLMADTPI